MSPRQAVVTVQMASSMATIKWGEMKNPCVVLLPLPAQQLEQMQTNDYNLLGVLAVVYRRRGFIIWSCAAVVAVTVVVALLLPNYYKATTSFYPASPSLLDPNRIYGSSDASVEYFGGDDEVNQLLSAAQSNQLLDYVIAEFDLYTVYEIDSTRRKAPYKVRRRLLKLYKVVKNDKDGIEVSVEDKDPQRAAAMANAIRTKIDETHRQFLKRSQERVMATYEQTLATRRTTLAMLSDSLARLRDRYQIYNIEAQSEFLSSYIPQTQARLANSEAKLKVFKQQGLADSVRVYTASAAALREQLTSLTKDSGNGTFNLEALNKGMAMVLLLESEVERLTDDISQQEEVYLRFRSIAEAENSSLVGVEVAEVPIIKSRPRRSIIVIGVAFMAFFVSVMGALLLENARRVDWSALLQSES